MRLLLTLFVPVAFIVAVYGPAAATVHTVDDSGGAGFTTIGEAIAASSDGDTILVSAGTYSGPLNRGLSLNNKRLVIFAHEGHVATTIDCGGQDRAFVLNASQDTTTVIRGFSIVNGYGGTTYPTSGGGIYIEFSSAPVIRDCWFEGNTATDGGAIAIGDGGHARIRDCVFTGNSATIFGGAINCNYDASIIRGCTFSGNTAPEGGAVRVYYSETAIIDCSFVAGNAATSDGGAIWHGESSSRSIVEGCTFTENTATFGGGIFTFYSSTTIANCAFSDNQATNEGGGLYAMAYGDSLIVAGCTFNQNAAHHGGGAEVRDAALTMTGCTFSGNEAGYWGGALYVASLQAGIITGCIFAGNYAAAGGGAVTAFGMPPSSGLFSCAFSNNSADGAGGAVRWAEGGGTIMGCAFDGNVSHADGGGALWCTGTPSPQIVACTFSGNETDDGEGAGIYDDSDGATIENTIVTLSMGGAGIAAGRADPEIEHCCVFANTGGDSLPGSHHDNMFVDPLFCDAQGDFTLCANSPCLAANNGWNELVGALGQGCPACESPAGEITWGHIKALYR